MFKLNLIIIHLSFIWILYSMSIPKIIHQIWIGTKPAPTEFMDTER